MAASGVGRSLSKSSNSSELMSGIPGSRAAKGLSGCLGLSPTATILIQLVVIALPVQQSKSHPSYAWDGVGNGKLKKKQGCRGMSTGIRKAACKGDIQTQKEERYLLYDMLHSMLYSSSRNLLNTTYSTCYIAEKGYTALLLCVI